MVYPRLIPPLFYIIAFLLTINISFAGTAHAGEFDVDEIITAIKNEIQTANISELGSPKFTIETVDVALTVISKETEKGALAVKIAGFSDELDDVSFASISYHNLSYSFRPGASSGFSPEISLGLVEPIRKVKSSFRKACNTPPSFQMDGFTFKLEFALVQDVNGGIRFRILALDDLKAQNIPTHHITLHIKISN